MDHSNCRDSNIAFEEILVLNAISLVSARMARRLAALAKQSQSEEGGKRNEQDERYGSNHRRAPHCCCRNY
ncbi:MAG: hypothetical protein IJQ02_05990 [Oscillospiraceae bacterium]|nr:hypothetical protein [Oscillospiraceae bacterium]